MENRGGNNDDLTDNTPSNPLNPQPRGVSLRALAIVALVGYVALNAACALDVRIAVPQAGRELTSAAGIVDSKRSIVCSTPEDTAHLRAKLDFASRRLDEGRSLLASYHPVVALFTWSKVRVALWDKADFAYRVAASSYCGQPAELRWADLYPGSSQRFDPASY